MAAPHVAALAALVGALNPHLTAAEKIRIIKETARRSGGWTPDLGWGILDAGRAVDVARRVDRLTPSSRVRVTKRRGRRVRLAFRTRDPGAERGLVPSGMTTARAVRPPRREAGEEAEALPGAARRGDPAAPRPVAAVHEGDGCGRKRRARPRRPDARVRVKRRR